jgi:hypothetical protein
MFEIVMWEEKLTRDSVWYYSHELGAKTSVFKPVNQTGNSSCSRSLPLHYYLRANGSEWTQY